MAQPIRKTSEQSVETTLSLLNDVLGSPALANVAVRLWDGTIWKPEPESPTKCTLVLQHPGALRKMFLPPSALNLGEAYIYNDFDIEGEIEAILPLIEFVLGRRRGKLEQLRYGARLLSLPNTNRPRPGDAAAKMRGRLHSKERDRQAIAYHYDHTPNDFFALFLDSRMVYSCAYFATLDDDLETVQESKLDYVCRKLRLQPGERLLDLGCGWGGLVIHAAQHYGVQADGITLSAQQAEFARERIKKLGLDERCRVDMRDYREINQPQAYDKLVAVGIAEHLGEALLPTYFKCAWELLRPGGVFLNHGIGKHSAIPGVSMDFLHRYVFPDGEPAPIGTTLHAAEAAGFGVRDVENLREHYAYTVRLWIRRLNAHADEAKRIGGEITYRIFRLYLLMAFRELEVGPANLYQSLLVKPENGRSCLPLRREDWYARSD